VRDAGERDAREMRETPVFVIDDVDSGWWWR
jgi:hypothetical protein